MTDVTTALDAVGALSGERMKYENWITALSTRTDAPSHVLEKVRADYAGRLRTVLEAFTAHVPALEEALADIQARDAVLAGQEQACRDDHAEGELRHVVGEFDTEQWEKVRVGHEALLARLGTERQGLATELAGVQRCLAATTDAAQRGRALGDVNASASAPASDALPSLRPAFDPQSSSDLVDEVFVPFVPVLIAPEPMQTPEELPFPPLAPVPVSGTERRGVDDELGFLRIVPREMPEEPADAALVTPTPSAGAPVVAPPVPTPLSTPPAPVDATKTLRCGECGIMNYPTEWYCERCGGELAAL